MIDMKDVYEFKSTDPDNEEQKGEWNQNIRNNRKALWKENDIISIGNSMLCVRLKIIPIPRSFAIDLGMISYS